MSAYSWPSSGLSSFRKHLVFIMFQSEQLVTGDTQYIRIGEGKHKLYIDYVPYSGIPLWNPLDWDNNILVRLCFYEDLYI